MNHLSNNLKFLRTKHKFTQEQVAEWLGVRANTYGHWENHVQIPAQYLKEISFLYKVSIEYSVKKNLSEIDHVEIFENYEIIQERLKNKHKL